MERRVKRKELEGDEEWTLLKPHAISHTYFEDPHNVHALTIYMYIVQMGHDTPYMHMSALFTKYSVCFP